MNKFFFILLAFIPVTVWAHFTETSPSLVFFLSAIAIVPLARFIGQATEEIASQTTAAVGGLLNATFGNVTEFIIGIFALRAGLIEVVKASITGSIIGNLLLVLGSAMLAGGWGRKKQTFNRTSILASGSTLFIAVIALVTPAIFLQTSSHVGSSTVEHMSIIVSVALIILYIANLVFSLRTHQHLYSEDVGVIESNWSKTRSLLTLFAATILVAWMSDILVGSVEPLIKQFGWTELFIGVVVIAIVGNAAEHASAITIAIKNRMDLALQIAMGSATQIAILVAPLLVLISSFMAHPMSLVFNTFELVSIVMSVIIVNLVVLDGESNWLEGLQLLTAYTILSVGFFYHS
jgi:Ca2+:H+ antiporter